MKANGKGIKKKIKEKIANMKAKVKGKCLGPCKSECDKCIGCGVVLAMLALCGCSTADPASRLTRADVGDIKVYIYEGAHHNTVTVRPADIGAFASADAEDTNETQTATPTNTTDIKPDVDVSSARAATADGK